MSRHIERDQLMDQIDAVSLGLQQHISDDDVKDNGCTLGNDVHDLHCMLETLKLLVDEAMSDHETEGEYYEQHRQL